MNIKKIAISLLISTIILSGCGNEKLPATEQDAVMISEEYLEETEVEEVESENSNIPKMGGGLELNLEQSDESFGVVQEYNGEIYTCIPLFGEKWTLIPYPQDISIYNRVSPTCLGHVAESFYITENGILYCIVSGILENEGVEEKRYLYKSDLKGTDWSVVAENLSNDDVIVESNMMFFVCSDGNELFKVDMLNGNVEKIKINGNYIDILMVVEDILYYDEVGISESIKAINIYTAKEVEILNNEDCFNTINRREYKDHIFYLKDNKESGNYILEYTDMEKKGSTGIELRINHMDQLFIYDNCLYYERDKQIISYSFLTKENKVITELNESEMLVPDIYVCGADLYYLVGTPIQEDGLNTNIYYVDLNTMEKKLIDRRYQE